VVASNPGSVYASPPFLLGSLSLADLLARLEFRMGVYVDRYVCIQIEMDTLRKQIGSHKWVPSKKFIVGNGNEPIGMYECQ
jgi:hypothetical protein